MQLVQTGASYPQEDREWFEANPGIDWYVRAPFPHELSQMGVPMGSSYAQESLQTLEELLARADCPEDAAIMVCVLQVKPGLRARVPGLTAPGNPILLLHPEGDEPIDPDRLLLKLREIRDREEMIDMRLSDNCDLCKSPYRTGDVTGVLARGSAPLLSLCVPCCLKKMRLFGGVLTALTVYLQGDTPIEERPQEEKERYQKGMKTAEAATKAAGRKEERAAILRRHFTRS